MHTVNNLLQSHVYTRKSMNKLANELSASSCFCNDHYGCKIFKIIFFNRYCGFGDYDINVISLALSRKGLAISWHDKREFFTINEHREKLNS
jgi:hypothetical protein